MLRMLDTLRAAAGTSPMHNSGSTALAVLSSHVFLHSLFVIGRGFPFHKGNGAGWAGGQAVAQAIAIIVPKKLCLPIHHADSPFMAGFSAGPASVALVFIYPNNFPNHFKSNPSLEFPG